MQFVLASASPRRKELLKELVQDFEIIPAVGEENCRELFPEKLVKALALQKAAERQAKTEQEKPSEEIVDEGISTEEKEEEKKD